MTCPFSPSSYLMFDNLQNRSPIFINPDPVENLSPLRLADPDLFITFESSNQGFKPPTPSKELLSSPQSDEDALEKTIKKRKLDQQFLEIIPQGTNVKGVCPRSLQPCLYPESSKKESFTVDSSFCLENSFAEFNMNQIDTKTKESEGILEEDNDLIILDDKPVFESKQRTNFKCPGLSLGGQSEEVMKIHKGAEPVGEVKMLNEHEKFLWQSFAKVHSHIPNFPLNEAKHLDYISLVLKHQAQHLFNIGRQHQQDYQKAKETRFQTPLSQPQTQSQPTNPIQDPRLVFENTQDKALLNKCPVMSTLIQKEDTSKSGESNPQLFNSPFPQTIPSQNPCFPHNQQAFPINMMHNQNMGIPHFQHGFLNHQYLHMFRQDLRFACPMLNHNGAKKSGPTRDNKERRSAFKKAVTKLKGAK